MKKEMICIRCPVGCVMQVERQADGTVAVTGNACKRGVAYGEKEIAAPARTVTSTIAVWGGKAPLCAVRTETDVPKEKIIACMAEIRAARAKAPVKIGDVLLVDVAGTGVNVVATCPVERAE